MTRPQPLPPESLYRRCVPDELPFESTDELTPLDELVGQDRALESVRFATGIDGDGFNIYALGTPGTGKFTMVQRMLAKEAEQRPTPPDWCYVYNFDEPHKPTALRLPPGRGAKLRADMDQLIEDLGNAIPAAFDSEEYRSRVEELEQELGERRDTTLADIAQQAKEHHIQFIHTPTGFAFAPLDKDGEVIRPDNFERLSKSERERIQHSVEELQKQLQRAVRQFPQWQKEMREKVKELDREFASFAAGHLIEVIQQRHADLPDVVAYLEAVERNIVDNIKEFRSEGEGPGVILGLTGGGGKAAALHRYRVNVLIDHTDLSAAPVIYQDLPTHASLIGRCEYQAHMGTLTTDFTLIKPGDLHRANGGYLILDVHELLMQPFAYDAIKRALRSRELRIESLEKRFGLISTVSLEPQPIPLDVKVVLIGERMLYYLLSHYDPDFRDLFKVAADFEDAIDRDDSAAMVFARFIAGILKEKGLRALEQGAVARVIEHSARLSEDADKLSVHLRSLSDLLREADYWAGDVQHTRTTREDVQRAIDAQIRRSDRVRERLYENIQKNTIKIDTAGTKVGQINGLSVIDLGTFSFGQPSRITATTRLGDGKLMDIERETELGGSIHTKGVLILSNFLAARYAKEQPLSLSASLVFEQSYGMVEGDSASLAELCALISAIADVPIVQSFAVTGSVNQLGEVQAIGGVNQKIEGFFDICRERGLTDDQGVLIPASNARHLMLRTDVVEAVREGKFAIYAVETVDEALELLTGLPAGERDEEGRFPEDSVNGRAELRLSALTELRQQFAHPETGEDETEGEEV